MLGAQVQEGCQGYRRDAGGAGGMPEVREGCRRCGRELLSTKLRLHILRLCALQDLRGAARREGFKADSVFP